MNTTPMVQLAPTFRVAPHVPAAAPDARLNPVVKVTVPPVNWTLPVLVTVTVCAVLVVFVSHVANVSEVGATVAVRTGVTPVPLRLTGEPYTVTLPVIVAVPFALPDDVGENTMPIVQVCAGGKLLPQLPPAAPVAREKGEVTVTVSPLIACPPLLVSVRFCTELVPPTGTLPNANDVGATVTYALFAD